jgi:hypothetical protein
MRPLFPNIVQKSWTRLLTVVQFRGYCLMGTQDKDLGHSGEERFIVLSQSLQKPMRRTTGLAVIDNRNPGAPVTITEGLAPNRSESPLGRRTQFVVK